MHHVITVTPSSPRHLLHVITITSYSPPHQVVGMNSAGRNTRTPVRCWRWCRTRRSALRSTASFTTENATPTICSQEVGRVLFESDDTNNNRDCTRHFIPLFFVDGYQEQSHLYFYLPFFILFVFLFATREMRAHDSPRVYGAGAEGYHV